MPKASEKKRLAKQESTDKERSPYEVQFKKNKTKPWLKKMWCIGKMDAEYRKRMYDILDLYADPYDSLYPV